MLFLEDHQTFKIHKYTSGFLPSLLIGEGLNILPAFQGNTLSLSGEFPRRVTIGEVIAEDQFVKFLAPVNGIAKIVKDYANQTQSVKLYIDGKLTKESRYNYKDYSLETLKQKIFDSGLISLDYPNVSLVSMIDNLVKDRESFIVFSPFTRENIIDFKERIFQNYSSELAELKRTISKIFPDVNIIDYLTNKNFSYAYPDGEPRYFLHKYCEFDISEEIDVNRILYLGPETVYYILKALYYDIPFYEREVPILIIDGSGNVIGESGIFTIKNGLNLKDFFQSIKGDYKYFTINSFYKKHPIFDLEHDFIFDIYNHSCIIICKSKINEQTETACIDCEDCSYYCPVEANPRVLLDKNYFDFKVDRCMECGICSVFCPSHINLEQKIQDAKRGVGFGSS
ncbi:MAG: hypothetical protein KDK90_10950 [Leptospiraceae bacterium]|nr:hypothetical protein [Leptospiraceae bacterium]